MKRHSTDYPGVFYRVAKRVGGKGTEKVYYAVLTKNGKVIEAKCGRQYKDAMTASMANNMRSEFITGKRLTPQEQRKAEATKKAEKVWTLDLIFDEYMKSRPDNKARSTDKGRYNKYLKPVFGKKEPHKIDQFNFDGLQRRISKKLKPQTVKHVIAVLKWAVNYGVRKKLCKPLDLDIKPIRVNNEKTEDLTPDQIRSLFQVIEADNHPIAGNMMKLALFTGMRRGEMFKLKWKHVDFDKNNILLKDPKGGVDQNIKMNTEAKELLQSIPRQKKTPYVFPGQWGRQRTIINHTKVIRDAAGLPKDFRPLHGLRHTYASIQASSGKVTMYQLQRLLGHKNPKTTQRYAHLRDRALRKASQVAGDVITEILNNKENSTDTKRHIA